MVCIIGPDRFHPAVHDLAGFTLTIADVMKEFHVARWLRPAWAGVCLALALTGCGNQNEDADSAEATSGAASVDTTAIVDSTAIAGAFPDASNVGAAAGDNGLTSDPDAGDRGDSAVSGDKNTERENAAGPSRAGNTSGGTLLYDRFEGTAGIVEQQRPQASIGTLTEVRAARQGNFDRIVFEFAEGAVPGYRVEYIDRPVRRCGTDTPVDLPGDAWLAIDFMPAEPRTMDGYLAVQNRSRIVNLPVLKEHALVCDAEGQVRWVLGLAAPNHYRVLELPSPPRLVVDILH